MVAIPVSFLLHVKHTLSYRILSYRIEKASPGGGTTTLGGGTAISGGGTPNTGGGTPFRPVPAEFNHCLAHLNLSTASFKCLS